MVKDGEDWRGLQTMGFKHLQCRLDYEPCRCCFDAVHKLPTKALTERRVQLTDSECFGLHTSGQE